MSTAGVAIYERTREHLTALHASLTNLPEREIEPSGLLRIAKPPNIGVFVLPAIVAAFFRHYPKGHFDIRSSGQKANLVKDGFDLAIRVATGPMKDSNLKVRRIGQNMSAVYAAPTYVARLDAEGVGVGLLPTFVERPYIREGLLEEIDGCHVNRIDGSNGTMHRSIDLDYAFKRILDYEFVKHNSFKLFRKCIDNTTEL